MQVMPGCFKLMFKCGNRSLDSSAERSGIAVGLLIGLRHKQAADGASDSCSFLYCVTGKDCIRPRRIAVEVTCHHFFPHQWGVQVSIEDFRIWIVARSLPGYRGWSYRTITLLHSQLSDSYLPSTLQRPLWVIHPCLHQPCQFCHV